MSAKIAISIQPLGVPMNDCSHNIISCSFKLKDAPLLLIIEDSEIIQKMYGLQMEALKYNYIIFSRGEPAIQAFQAIAFDLVICDIGLPDISGVEICKQMRKIRTHKHIPILSISTQEESDQKNMLEAGADASLMKPVLMSVLTDTINNLLNK